MAEPLVFTGIGRSPIVNGFSAKPHGFENFPRLTRLALTALDAAWDDAMLDQYGGPRDRIGIYFGTAFAILDSLRDFEADLAKRGLKAAAPSAYQELTLGALTGHLAIHRQIDGPAIPVMSSACAGAHALLLAKAALDAGDIELALVGAGESRDAALAAGDSGETIADGALFLVVERSSTARLRGRAPYADFGGVVLEQESSQVLDELSKSSLSLMVELAAAAAQLRADPSRALSRAGVRTSSGERASVLLRAAQTAPAPAPSPSLVP